MQHLPPAVAHRRTVLAHPYERTKMTDTRTPDGAVRDPVYNTDYTVWSTHAHRGPSGD